MEKLNNSGLLRIGEALGSSLVVCITDPAGTIQGASGPYCEMTKLPRSQIVGQPYQSLKSSDHDQDFFANLWTTVARGEVWRGEIKTREKGDLCKWLDTTIVPCRDSSGQINQYIALHRDITESKRTEVRLTAALKELESQKFALDQSAIVATTDRRGVITYVNDLFCEISKYDRSELIGQTHKLINSGYHDPKFFKEMWDCISSGKVWRGEICNRTKDGKLYWVETTIVPFLDETKKPYLYTSIRKDVTYKKKAESQIRDERAKTIYAEKMASLGEMSAGIAHELGNPLGAIRGRLEMLELAANQGPVEQSKILDTTKRVIRLADRMSKIIRGLRSYARDGSKDPFMSTDLSSLIADILEFSTEKFRKLGINVNSVGIDSPIFVECREAEIGQIIVNLTSNACDAIKDLEDRWVEIKLEDIGDNIEISVTDAGPGISQQEQEKIFESFYSTKPVGSGTGLGLSITKTIIDSHSGELKIDNNCENTRFVVRLPKTQNQ